MVYDCDSFLVISTGWLVIMIVSWAFGEYHLFLRSILVGSIIVIVSWVIENNLVYFRGYSGWVYDCVSFLVISPGCDCDSFLGCWGK